MPFSLEQFGETLQGVEAGELPVCGWLGALKHMLNIAESKIGGKASRTLSFQWCQVLPEAEIIACKNRLIVQFRQKRSAQWQAKIQQPARRKS